MKFTSTILTLTVSLLTQASNAQLNNGGLYANFGVDADTRGNYMKYGLVTGAVASDDCFSPLYNQTTGVFTTAGPDAGHTQWLFDAGGNLILTGDMILAVDFTPGLARWLTFGYG